MMQLSFLLSVWFGGMGRLVANFSIILTCFAIAVLYLVCLILVFLLNCCQHSNTFSRSVHG